MFLPPTLVLAIGLGWPQMPPTLADLEFTMAVEESVMAEPGTAPPEPFTALIDRLGSDCFQCREIATRKLQSVSRFKQQWLFWGRRHRDPEVRLRANAIIRRINPCSSCGGSGESRHYPGYPCWDCQGFRTLWLWSMWD
jgi:hypothetical protein